jgi:hypothetical protein
MTSSPTAWEETANDLKQKIWKTKGARFNAHQRLQNRHTWSITSISFLSVYVIILTLLVNISFITLSSTQNSIASFSAMVLSLFILVLSLMETSKSYEAKSREFHECGRQLSGIYDRLMISMAAWNSNQGNANIQKELFDIANEYNNILDKCHENHDIIDFELFKVEHNQDFNLGIIDRITIRFKAFCSKSLTCILFVLLPPITIIPLMLLL